MPAARRVGGQRRGIDGAEHRSILKCVMADDDDPPGNALQISAHSHARDPLSTDTQAIT
jgi:hypothetical protein